MSLYFISRSSESFLFIILTSFPFFYLSSLFLKFNEFRSKLITLIKQLSHLREKDNIRKMKPTVFVIVAKVIVIRFVTHSEIIRCQLN